MKRTVLILLVVSLAVCVNAQNATSSPSSRYGYGELNDNLPASYRAMGGVGIGMRSGKAINSAQPASYTACDSMTFMFDIAGSLLYTNYGDAFGRRNRMNGNLEYVTLQFPIWKHYIAFSAGMTPYSAVGYDFAISDSLNSDYHYTKSYAGEGGITQVYGGLSFNICDWVALGVNAYYMFGSVTQSRTLSFSESSLNTIKQSDDLHINSLRLRYGIQLFHTWGDHTIVLGGVLENKQRFSRSEYLQVESTTSDTVSSISGAFEMPMMYGAGLSYNYGNRLTVALDYQCHDWSKAQYFNQTSSLRARQRWSAGVEYRHNPMSRNYAERMYWRAGFNYATSYAVDMTRPDIGVSVGMGFPLRTVGTVINTTFEYGHRSAGVGLLSENYLRFVVNAAISETWFFKRKL